MGSGVGRHYRASRRDPPDGSKPEEGYRSLAVEWAEIYRVIEVLSKRRWPKVLAGLCRARQILLAAVPAAAERARIAIEAAGLG
jgi:hypothetical protein